MVLIGFCWTGRRAFVRRLLWLFSLSAALAGVCGALYFFVAPAGFYVFNGVVYYSVPPLLLVGLTVLCYAALWLVERVLRRRRQCSTALRLRYTGRGRRQPCPACMTAAII